MRSLTRLVPFFIFLILAYSLAAVNGQSSCGTSGNYTSGSSYQANLDFLVRSLSANVDENGFYNASMGENNDTAYALVLCRGDLQLDTCRSCIQDASVNLARICPNQREAIYWNEQCMLRYSDEPLFRTLATAPVSFEQEQPNASSPDQFNTDLRILIQDLWAQAANGSSLRKVAAGSRPTADFHTIYALMQCTPDLTPEECTTCLTLAAQVLPICCESRQSARVVRPSCNLVYNGGLILPFYNNSRLLELARDPAVIPVLVAPTLPGNQAWRTWQEGRAANLIDPALRGSSSIPRDMLRCIHIGLLCVQQNAGDRPTMGSVVQMLISFSSTLPVPSEPQNC